MLNRLPRLPALLLTAAFLVLLSSACGGTEGATDGLNDEMRSGRDTPIVVPAGKPIVIGVSAPLTGPEAPAGREDLHAVITGAELWKAANGPAIEGHAIELRAEDDGCTDTETAASAAERLLRTPGLTGVIGPNCSAGAEAAIPVYADAGIVAISGSATATGLTSIRNGPPYFFRTAYRNDLQGTLIGIHAAMMVQAKLVYVIDDSEPYGRDLAESADRVMKDTGVQTLRRSVTQGTVDFSELAGEIAKAQPGLVAFLGFNPEAALLYRQLRDAGYTGLYGAGDAAASEATFIEPVGAKEAEAVLFSGCAVQLPEDARTRLREIHGGDTNASAFPAQYIDAATILLDAVKKVAEPQSDGSLLLDPGVLRAAVHATALEGVSGAFAFDENGDRLPPALRSVDEVVRHAVSTLDLDIYVQLGLIPCQVQDGRLVNLIGPGAGQMRGMSD